MQKRDHFRPDLIYAHPAWGETLYVKDVFPDIPLVHYCEFFYHGTGADVFFDPAETITLQQLMRVRTKNAVNLLALEACDVAVTPTNWQWRLHPPSYRSKMAIIHDGVDVERARPDSHAYIELPGGGTVTAADEVVTYVNRSLEPCRGLFSFVDAVEIIAKARPRCRFLILGKEDGRYYGPHPPAGTTYQKLALRRVTAARDRLYFLGRLPYPEYLKVLQISSAHVYLSSPFVLSWSMLEAMATGCVVVGSNTPPVVEVIVDGHNGLLADFFSAEEIAERVLEALERSEQMRSIRSAARRTVIERYALAICLQKQIALIEGAVAQRSARAP
jgi:glycosyltransferase involved in cell wall biosynthesis